MGKKVIPQAYTGSQLEDVPEKVNDGKRFLNVKGIAGCFEIRNLIHDRPPWHFFGSPATSKHYINGRATQRVNHFSLFEY